MPPPLLSPRDKDAGSTSDWFQATETFSGQASFDLSLSFPINCHGAMVPPPLPSKPLCPHNSPREMWAGTHRQAALSCLPLQQTPPPPKMWPHPLLQVRSWCVMASPFRKPGTAFQGANLQEGLGKRRRCFLLAEHLWPRTLPALSTALFHFMEEQRAKQAVLPTSGDLRWMTAVNRC